MQAVTEYTEELLTSLREYLDVAEASDGNLEDQSVSPEAEGERIEEWAVEVVDRLRFHWFQQLCPIALWNRRLEEELRDMGLEDCSCPPERYEEERREARARRLSRSRTPQRRFPPNRAQELRAARDEVDSDEVGFMDSRGSRDHNRGRGDSRDSGWRRGSRGGDDDREWGRDLSGVNPRWLDNRTRSPGDRRSGNDGRARPAQACVTREVRRLQPTPTCFDRGWRLWGHVAQGLGLDRVVVHRAAAMVVVLLAVATRRRTRPVWKKAKGWMHGGSCLGLTLRVSKRT